LTVGGLCNRRATPEDILAIIGCRTKNKLASSIEVSASGPRVSVVKCSNARRESKNRRSPRADISKRIET